MKWGVPGRGDSAPEIVNEGLTAFFFYSYAFYEHKELCVDTVIVKSEQLMSDTDGLAKS